MGPVNGSIVRKESEVLAAKVFLDVYPYEKGVSSFGHGQTLEAQPENALYRLALRGPLGGRLARRGLAGSLRLLVADGVSNDLLEGKRPAFLQAT